MRQLFALDWNGGDADEEFAESASVRACNVAVLWRKERFDEARAEAAIQCLPAPWAVKDPRFVLLLQQWVPVFGRLNRPPTLIWLTKSTAQVKESFRRRKMVKDGVPVSHGLTVEDLFAMANTQFEAWPWQKLMIRYEDLATASALFKPRIPQ
jgi:hypothetical protein